MNLKYCKNIAEDTFELLLVGEVGKEINGREVASEILYLNSIGAKVIKERINTIGGSIMDAFSIVSANISSDAEIHTINEGVADSAGSFILASGTRGKRSAMDFATMMVHNPSVQGVMLEDMEDGSLKDELIMMRDSIVTILSNNSGKTKEEVIALMAESTRMDSQSALNFGFIDSIIESINTPEIVENMSMAELMNVCKDFNNKPDDNNPQIENKMEIKDLENKVENLSGQLTAKDETISGLENKVSERDETIEGMKNQATEKDSTIADLQNKVKEFETKEIENAVKVAVDSGKFGEDSEEKLTTQCTAMGVENFNIMVGMVKLPQANAAGQIDNKGEKKKTDKTKEKELADEYQNLAENDSAELKEIKNTDPKRYEEMFNAWNKA